jgi:small subunit ribosomal protein S27e
MKIPSGDSQGGFIMKIKEPSSKFVKIRCPKCKNEQIMFGKASSKVVCLVCEKILAEPTGGKSKIKARILEVLE